MKNKFLIRFLALILLPISVAFTVSDAYGYWVFNKTEAANTVTATVDVAADESIPTYVIKFKKIDNTEWYYDAYDWGKYSYKQCKSSGTFNNLSTNTAYDFTYSSSKNTWVLNKSNIYYNYNFDYTYYTLSFDGTTLTVDATCTEILNYFNVRTKKFTISSSSYTVATK